MRSCSHYVPVRCQVAHSVWFPLCHACLFLVGHCVESPKALNINNFLIFCRIIHHPKQQEIIPLHIPPQSQSLLIILPLPITNTVFGWLSCVSLSFGGHLWPCNIFFHIIFLSSNCCQKWRVIVLPQCSTLTESRQKYPPHSWYFFWQTVRGSASTGWRWCVSTWWRQIALSRRSRTNFNNTSHSLTCSCARSKFSSTSFSGLASQAGSPFVGGGAAPSHADYDVDEWIKIMWWRLQSFTHPPVLYPPIALVSSREADFVRIGEYR